jgi:hypothetical protein
MTKNSDIYNVKQTNYTFPPPSFTPEVTSEEEDMFNQVMNRIQSSYNSSKQQYEDSNFQPDSIVTSIQQEMNERAEMGFNKYNATLDRIDLSVIDYLQHAKEECLDLALYLEKTIQMLSGMKGLDYKKSKIG